MQAKMTFTISVLLALPFSAPILAHTTEPGAVLPHIFTGEHLLLMVLTGVCVAVVSRFRGRSR